MSCAPCGGKPAPRSSSIAWRAVASLGYALKSVVIAPLLPLYRTTISYHDTTPDATIHSMPHKPTDEDYRRLLELRTGLRRFLRWSEQHARSAGLPPAQHQLL